MRRGVSQACGWSPAAPDTSGPIVRALQTDGQRVVVVDDLSTGLTSRVPSNTQLEVFSLLDTKQLARVMRDLHVTGVVHLAAKKAAGESVDEPVYYYYENIGGMISLLRAMEAAGVQKLVYSFVGGGLRRAGR